MQQREQLILKKLAEAREAQASAMTRFIQTRARAMQAEARLQALRSRLALPQTVSSQPAETPPLPTDAANLPEILPLDAPTLSQPSNAGQASSTEPLPLTSETPALDAEQSINELATTLLDLEQFADLVADLEQTDEPNDDEDTKKQQAIQLPRPFTLPVRLNRDEAEASLLIQAGLVETNEAAETTTSDNDTQAEAQAAAEASPVPDTSTTSSELKAFAHEQPAETSPIPDTSATDITAKIPVIRQPRRKQKESE